MRKIEIYKDDEKVIRRKTVESPWLRQEEAAMYCGISRSAFRSRAEGKLPHGGDKYLKLYHTKILDAFIEGRIPDAPFGAEPVPVRRGKRKRRKISDQDGIVDPVSGKFYPSGGQL